VRIRSARPKNPSSAFQGVVKKKQPRKVKNKTLRTQMRSLNERRELEDDEQQAKSAGRIDLERSGCSAELQDAASHGG